MVYQVRKSISVLKRFAYFVFLNLNFLYLWIDGCYTNYRYCIISDNTRYDMIPRFYHTGTYFITYVCYFVDTEESTDPEKRRWERIYLRPRVHRSRYKPWYIPALNIYLYDLIIILRRTASSNNQSDNSGIKVMNIRILTNIWSLPGPECPLYKSICCKCILYVLNVDATCWPVNIVCFY